MQFWAFYRTFRRWKWVILAVCLFVPCVIVALTITKPRSYVAQATVRPYQEAYQELATSGSELERVQSKVGPGNLVGLMQTRSFWQEVREKLSVSIPYEDFREKLKQSSSKDTDMIFVSWQDREAERAVNTVNAIVDVFGVFYAEQQTADFTRTREVLENQVKGADKDLQAANKALLDFQNKNGLADATDLAAMTEEHRSLKAQSQALDLSIRQAQARVSALAAQMSGTTEFKEISKTMRPNPDMELLRSALLDAKTRYVELQQKYNPDHPRITAIQKSIAELEQQVKATKPVVEGETELAPNQMYEGIDTALRNAQVELNGLMAQQGELQSRRQALEARLPELPHLTAELDQLTRAADLAKQKYQQSAEAYNEAAVSEQSAKQKARIRVIDYATLPLEPQPRLVVKKAIMGFVASVFLSLTLILFLEQLDNRIKGPDDVERVMKIHTLGAVPLLDAADLAGQTSSEEPLEDQFGPATFREAIRRIRSQLFLLGGDPPPRVLGIVSTRGSVGKTTLAANLAESIAQAGHSVLLVDGDLRRPTVHTMYDLPNRRGLANVLLGEIAAEGAIVDTDVPGLSVLTAGPTPEDAPVLLGSQAMRDLIAALRKTYTWIIVDTPAGLAHGDAVVTSVALDAVLMVTAAGEIARGAENRLLTEFAAVGTQVLGAVVNKVLPKHADTLYHYQQYYHRARARAQEPEAESPPPSSGESST